MRCALLELAAIVLLASSGSASDLRVLVQGPAAGGVVEFGFHDDYLQLEGCGSTCFAPTVCQVHVPVLATDSPLEVAEAIARAIRTNAVCNAAGFRARALAHPAGAVLEITDGEIDQYNVCVNFWTVADQWGLCGGSTPQTPGGFFTGLSATYCSAKANGAGCGASIDTLGTPSISSPEPFAVVASNVEGGAVGLLLYGVLGGGQVPIANGTLCIHPPVRRTLPVGSSASPFPAGDCSSLLTFDFNLWAQSGVDPAIQGGTAVAAQYWIRDPEHWDGTGTALSNAVEFIVEH